MTSTSIDRIDGLNAALAIKAPVRVATTANITLSGEQTIDGIAVVENNRVLVKNQTNTTANGLYTCETGAWTRAKDFDGARDAIAGTLIYVRSGTVNAGSYWRLTTTSDPVVFGTDNITFEGSGTFWPANINAQTGTTYTLTASDHGKIVTFNNAAAVTVAAPQTSAETLSAFQCTIIQRGAGQVTVAVQGSDT